MPTRRDSDVLLVDPVWVVAVNRLMRSLVALDSFLNVLLFDGLPDETISARAATAMRQGKRWGCVLCGLLDKIDPNHCEKAIAGDIERAAAVIEDVK